MKRAIVAAAAIGLTASASAQVARPLPRLPRGPGPSGPIMVPPRPPIVVARSYASIHIVDNPDGSFVSDIDGKKRNFGFKPGSIHSIRGKGFGRKNNANVLLLKSSDGRYNANLSVTRWDDDLIVAQVPTDQGGFPSADKLTLLIMTAGATPRQFKVEGGKFQAEEAEVLLPMSGFERSALEAAGLRVRVWNRGKEALTFERDGGVTVTHYIDFDKEHRSTPCPAAGFERLDIGKLDRSLKLQPGFRITRIDVAPPQSHYDFKVVGRYTSSWQAVDDRRFFRVDWPVWRMRRDETFTLGGKFDIDGHTFGRHTPVPRQQKVTTACGAEFTLTFFVTGPRGLSPR